MLRSTSEIMCVVRLFDHMKIDLRLNCNWHNAQAHTHTVNSPKPQKSTTRELIELISDTGALHNFVAFNSHFCLHTSIERPHTHAKSVRLDLRDHFEIMRAKKMCANVSLLVK